MRLQTRLARMWATLVALIRTRYNTAPHAALPPASPPAAAVHPRPTQVDPAPAPPPAAPAPPPAALAPPTAALAPPLPSSPDMAAALLALPPELLQTSVRRFFGRLGQPADDVAFDFSRWQTASVDRFYRALSATNVRTRGPAIDRDAALSLPEALAGFHWD